MKKEELINLIDEEANEAIRVYSIKNKDERNGIIMKLALQAQNEESVKAMLVLSFLTLMDEEEQK